MQSEKNPEYAIRVSNHACERARQRYRWNSQTLNRIALRAYESGLQRKNTNGYLKIYLDRSWENHQHTSNFRIYGEMIFVFQNSTLVTLWNLPSEFRSLAKVFRIKYQQSIASA